jgi:peptidoglycan/xylan/chitin deacetylase (PgdA/CDA1 family)
MYQRRNTLIVFLILAALLMIAAGAFLRRQYVAPILMYHSVTTKIDPDIRGLIVSPQSFERHMSFLKRHRYHVIPLADLAVLISEGRRVPPKTVALTFDDGYKDNFTYVFPILKKYGFPATIFVIYGEVSRPQSNKLSWEEIRLMQDSGLIYFGSHTLGVKSLLGIKSAEELRRQIVDSKTKLEERLGQPVTLFSYPEGGFNDTIRTLVIKAGYRAAVATNPGKRFADNDIFALKRIRISSNCDNLLAYWLESSGYYNFLRERHHR